MAGIGAAHLRDSTAETVLSVRDLSVDYGRGNSAVQAVSEVSFDILEGETLGIVGESGCGKSTTGRAAIGLQRASAGSVEFDGSALDPTGRRINRAIRQRMQMVFQDPRSSLNPRRRVRDIVVEGLAIQNVPALSRRSAAQALLESVGLDPVRVGQSTPGSLSGGQAQRVAIARALAVRPRLIVCDEPVSALDVSVQAQILNLLRDLKEEYSLTLLFVSHDLSVVRLVSDRVMVMYLGRVCEVGATDQVFNRPAHPYTKALLDAVPDISKGGSLSGPALQGEIPSPAEPPTGCRFRTRCPIAIEECSQQVPVMRSAGDDHFVACHRATA